MKQMKNLVVLMVFAFGLFVGTQNINAQKEVSSVETKVVAPPVQEKFVELATENLPQKVLDAVAKDFVGATIKKAAANEDASEFKLIIKDGERETEVFCDADGNWIRKK